MVLTFLGQTIAALVQQVPASLSAWAWLKATELAIETAAWRLKWVAIPAVLIVLWSSRKIYRPMLQSPARYCGLRYARRGLRISALVCLLIVTFIGVSVPTRLVRRHEAREAATHAWAYRIDRAMLEYAARFHTFPPDDYEQALKRLPDPDGSLAEALRELGPGAYKTSGPDLAALPGKNMRTLRGAAIRKASLDSTPDNTLAAGVSFTNYEIRLPGPDKAVGTDDDLILRDGVITRASEAGPGVIGSTASTSATKP